MPMITLTVPNINCEHCVHTIQTELADLAGVTSVKADSTSKKVLIVFETPADEIRIRETLVEINYPAI
jgi:copper chaperone CopZ